MPGLLIDLTSYKTLSDTQLVDNYNQLVDALNSNFDFTLTQVSNPVPTPSLGNIGDVMTIQSGYTLGYNSITNLVEVQAVFNKFLATPQTLRLNNSLTLSLLSPSSSLSSYLVAASIPGGGTVDRVLFQQLSTAGDMLEQHNVSQFQVTAGSASLSVASGYFQINALQIGTYAFPTSTPQVNQVLQANSSGNLEFKTLPEYLSYNGSYYSLSTSKPLVFTQVKYPALNASFGTNLRSGFGFDDITLGGAYRMYFRMVSSDVFYLTKPADVMGQSVSPYLEMKRGLVLPPSSSIDPISNPTGSLWYDSGIEGLILITGSGRKYISSQAMTSSVNTEEAKDFVLQPASTLTVDSGTEAKPALNIGSAGLTASNEGNLKVVVNGSTVAQISSEGLESPTAGVTAAAKVLLSDTVGINNAERPAYSFSGSSGLGMFRSDIDAVAVAVKGATVVEFSESKVNVKGNQISNVAEPQAATDAATKGYVDSIVPIGATPGALPIVSTGETSKYVQSDAKYLNGTLEIGNTATPAAFRMNSSGGGAVILRAPSTNNSVVFELPANSLNGGILQTLNGKSSWVDPAVLTANAIKADGSVSLTGGLAASVDTTAAAPLLGRSSTGMYVGVESEVKVGFSAQGSRLLEASASKGALVGATDSFNAPYIRLKNTISSYSATGSAGMPTYAFAGESSTGVGQTQVQNVSLIVNGSAKMSASPTGLNAHNNKLQALADPTVSTDAATKNYVDTVAKPRKELSFLVLSLPTGWSGGSAIILSIYDKALIYGAATAALTYESASDATQVIVPGNFSTNPDCQVFVDSFRLVKMPKSSGIREVAYATNRSIVLNYNLSVGQVITVHLPG